MRDKRIKQLEDDFADTQQQYTECYDEVSHAQCEITCNQAVLLPLKYEKERLMAHSGKVVSVYLVLQIHAPIMFGKLFQGYI